jgi:thymidylate synthase ThyX
MSSSQVGIRAKVIADSFYKAKISRLTTFEVTFPRFILAEFNTHRLLSRNSASSRAIPVWKRIKEVLEHPFVPIAFGKNKPGMQASEIVADEDQDAARHNWLVGRDIALIQAFTLVGGRDQIMSDAKGSEVAANLCDRIDEISHQYPDVSRQFLSMSAGVHKQHANRVLETYAWHTVIVTATHWRNFYALRASPMAQPEIQSLAIAMAEAHFSSVPKVLEDSDWHLPYVFPEDYSEIDNPKLLARISSARCARVSYLTHDGKRSLEADLNMANNLQENGHMSPFEHPAKAGASIFGIVHLGNESNFGRNTWTQYRKLLDNESDFSELISRRSLLEGMKQDGHLVDFVLSLRD